MRRPVLILITYFTPKIKLKLLSLSSNLGAPQNKAAASKNNRRPASSGSEDKNSSTPQEQQQSNVQDEKPTNDLITF
jgi:hypothetical protein